MQRSRSPRATGRPATSGGTRGPSRRRRRATARRTRAPAGRPRSCPDPRRRCGACRARSADRSAGRGLAGAGGPPPCGSSCVGARRPPRQGGSSRPREAPGTRSPRPAATHRRAPPPSPRFGQAIDRRDDLVLPVEEQVLLRAEVVEDRLHRHVGRTAISATVTSSKPRSRKSRVATSEMCWRGLRLLSLTQANGLLGSRHRGTRRSRRSHTISLGGLVLSHEIYIDCKFLRDVGRCGA